MIIWDKKFGMCSIIIFFTLIHCDQTVTDVYKLDY